MSPFEWYLDLLYLDSSCPNQSNQIGLNPHVTSFRFVFVTPDLSIACRKTSMWSNERRCAVFRCR